MQTRDRYLLGLNIGHSDPSASLCKGSEVICHVEEERFVREKNAFDRFPTEAVRYCLARVPGGLSGVESINLGFDFTKFSYEVPLFYLREWSEHREKPKEALTHEEFVLGAYHPEIVKERVRKELEAAGFVGAKFPPIRFFNHHYCHALSAHLASPFEKSLAVVADGRGELDTVSVWDCSGTQLQRLYSRELPHSLGWVYRAFTVFCGFEPYSGEGKLMGLAPYGKPNPAIASEIEKILIWEEDENGEFNFSVNQDYIYSTARYPANRILTQRFVDIFGTPATSTDEQSDHHRSVAYEIQDRFEKTLLQLVARFLKQTGHHYLSLAGGVFLNCKVNGYIWRESDELEDIYIMPMSGDDSIGLSANMAYAVQQISQKREDYSLPTVYLGPEFSDQEIEEARSGFNLRPKFLHERQYNAISCSLGLKRTAAQLKEEFENSEKYCQLNATAQAFLEAGFQRREDIVEYAAEKLAGGALVAWFQGRMEAGPRALGARSILADPRTIRSRDIVNLKVKFREAWRPFCPSVLAEHAEEYFRHSTQSPYMINTFQVTEKAKAEAPAIVHVDDTARPQFLTKEANSRFHALISAFYEKTGVPILLNTSMNIKGEPICCTPDNAFQFFFATDIDVLVMSDFAIEKNR